MCVSEICQRTDERLTQHEITLRNSTLFLLFDDIIVNMFIVDICSLVIVVWFEQMDAINRFILLTATFSIIYNIYKVNI